MSYYLKDGELLWPTQEGIYDVRNGLPVGTYTVGMHPQRGFFLKPISEFAIKGKVYGKTTRHADRILSTFADRPNSTGVLLNGEKGSGKTMLAKLISQKAAEKGIPTLVINTAFTGDAFNTFIQSINEPCMIVFDEFEKVFDEKEQEAILTLLDGVYPSKKLFVLTCNDRYRVNQHMTNRPGRIFYFLEFKGLELDFIEEYCQDALDNKIHIAQICRLTMMYSTFNFDMLKALVEEMNRYDETPNEALEMLNARPFVENDRTKYGVKVSIDGGQLEKSMIDPPYTIGNPLSKDGIDFYIDQEPDNVDSSCFNLVVRPTDLKKADPIAGTFVYVLEESNKVTVVTLTREQESFAFDWRSAI